MTPLSIVQPLHSVAGLLACVITLTGCASATQSTRIPSEPTLHWPDPAFLAERQCRGGYRMEDLARLLPRARLAMSLPGTRSVALDSERRCIVIDVQNVGDGRLAELVMRGVAVPRTAVSLRLAN